MQESDKAGWKKELRAKTVTTIHKDSVSADRAFNSVLLKWTALFFIYLISCHLLLSAGLTITENPVVSLTITLVPGIEKWASMSHRPDLAALAWVYVTYSIPVAAILIAKRAREFRPRKGIKAVLGMLVIFGCVLPISTSLIFDCSFFGRIQCTESDSAQLGFYKESSAGMFSILAMLGTAEISLVALLLLHLKSFSRRFRGN